MKTLLTFEELISRFDNNELEVLNDIQVGKVGIINDSKSYNYLGMQYYKLGGVDQAEVYFELAVLLQVMNVDAIYNLGTLYFNNLHLEEAGVCFETITLISSSPELVTQAFDFILEISSLQRAGTLPKIRNNSTFLSGFITFILKSMKNNYTDNVDFDRYSRQEGIHKLMTTFNNKVGGQIVGILPILENLYQVLNPKDKQCLVQVLAYQMLGLKKVKLPLNTQFYWNERQMLNEYICSDEIIPLNFKGWHLSHFNLKEMGIPLELYYTASGIQSTFVRKQYEYGDIKAEEGDFVIDAGGCYGDTALYFSNEVGLNGQVYTFEFIESNLIILKNNLALNGENSNNVKVIERPLWNTSDLDLYYIDNGPGSIVRPEKISNNLINTLAIDDFVKIEEVPRIDFIKMDIEGAELHTLRGAEQTIRAYKPKLAISIYHSIEEYATIFAYIDSLDLGYKFYMNHFTIFGEETVLFAKVENQ